MVAASPVITLRTPGGRPASSARAARASPDSGVSGAGLTTTVQPAARAAPIFRAIRPSGKFHGVIAAATPAGCRITQTRLSRWAEGITVP